VSNSGKSPVSEGGQQSVAKLDWSSTPGRENDLEML